MIAARILAALLLAAPAGANPLRRGQGQEGEQQLVDLTTTTTTTTAGAAAGDSASLIRRGLDAARVAKRAGPSADFSLDRTWINETLWNGKFKSPSGQTGLTVKCTECWTKGSVTASLAAASRGSSSHDDGEPVLRFAFNQVSAYVAVEANVTTSLWTAVDLFASQTPIGVKGPNSTVGVVLAVDAIFSFGTAVALSGGFWLRLPDRATMDVGLLSGDVRDTAFDGMVSGALPLSVSAAGAATTFKANLRVRVQAGVEASTDELGVSLGAGVVLGVYVNVLELVTVVQPRAGGCGGGGVQAAFAADLNAGAYARASVVIGPSQMGPTPTASTTLLRGATRTSCLAGSPVSSSLTSATSDDGGGGEEPTAITTPAPAGGGAKGLVRLVGPAIVAGKLAASAASQARASRTLRLCRVAAGDCPAGEERTIMAAAGEAATPTAEGPGLLQHVMTGAVGLVALAKPTA